MISSALSPCLGHDFTAPAAAAEAARVTQKRQRIADVSQARMMTDDGQRKAPPRGYKNPIPPEEELRSYKLRMRLTPAQEEIFKQWAAAGRGAYNALLAAHQDPARRLPLTLASANQLCKASDTWMPGWMQDAQIPHCVYKNAMMDLVSAQKGNQTKKAKNTHHQWAFKFRSLRADSTEAIRLDAAIFRPNDPLGLQKPNDCGPVLRVLPVPEPQSNRTQGPTYHMQYHKPFE